MNFTQADIACQAEGAALATFKQLGDAQQLGMHLCVAGWIEGGRVGYPTRFPSTNCGDNHVGLVMYKDPVDQSSKYDAYCYRLKEVSCSCPEGYVGNGDFCNGVLTSVLATNGNFSIFYKSEEKKTIQTRFGATSNIGEDNMKTGRNNLAITRTEKKKLNINSLPPPPTGPDPEPDGSSPSRAVRNQSFSTAYSIVGRGGAGAYLQQSMGERRGTPWTDTTSYVNRSDEQEDVRMGSVTSAGPINREDVAAGATVRLHWHMLTVSGAAVPMPMGKNRFLNVVGDTVSS
ncbi:hypothetical protein AMECASPLE_025713 [Ameca splendens]|uniref:Link domain-containing protein n=1 Tax=Ameca splendens TaxID=208324 RepID=A0ABV1ABW9_9TELE